MAETTFLEARYLIRSKLDSLLASLFGSASHYSIKVRMFSRQSTPPPRLLRALLTNTAQAQGDNVEVTAPRALTRVSPTRRLLHFADDSR